MVEPRRRTSGLVIREVGDETVVFDERRNTAHRLEPIASRVWSACDGTGGLAARAGVTEVQAEAALASLSEADLLAEDGFSRRRLLVRAGTVVGGAAVATIGAPLVAAHASTGTVTPHLPPVGSTWSLTEAVASACSASGHPNPDAITSNGVVGDFAFFSAPLTTWGPGFLTPPKVSDLTLLSWGGVFCGINAFHGASGTSPVPLLTANPSSSDIVIDGTSAMPSVTWTKSGVGAGTGNNALVIAWYAPASGAKVQLTGAVSDMYGVTTHFPAGDIFGANGQLLVGSVPNGGAGTVALASGEPTAHHVYTSTGSTSHAWTINSTLTLQSGQALYVVLTPFSVLTEPFVPLNVALTIAEVA